MRTKISFGDFVCGCGDLQCGNLEDGLCEPVSANDEAFPTTVVERLALRARARRSASSTAAPTATASAQAWQFRSNESDSEEEGDDYGFVLPPGWHTLRIHGNENKFSWTDGGRTVHAITEAWEIFAASGGGRGSKAGADAAMAPADGRESDGVDPPAPPAGGCLLYTSPSPRD